MKRYLGGFLKRLDKAGILKYFNFNTSITLNNKRLIVPVINGIGYQLLNMHEKWAFDLYKKLLTLNPGTFIDVGANNGQTLLKIAAIQPSLSYIGFEPNPGCFYYVQKLAIKNKFTGYEIFPVGLYTENKIVTLISDNNFASGATIVLNLRKNVKKYSIKQHVPVMTGDEILNELTLSKVSIIKADVEGAEVYAIKGLVQTIMRHQPFIVLEILPVYTLNDDNGRNRKMRQDELLNTLHSLAYTMFRVNEATGGLEQLADIEIHGDMTKTNYVFVPKDKVASFKAL